MATINPLRQATEKEGEVVEMWPLEILGFRLKLRYKIGNSEWLSEFFFFFLPILKKYRDPHSLLLKLLCRNRHLFLLELLKRSLVSWHYSASWWCYLRVLAVSKIWWYCWIFKEYLSIFVLFSFSVLKSFQIGIEWCKILITKFKIVL